MNRFYNLLIVLLLGCWGGNYLYAETCDNLPEFIYHTLSATQSDSLLQANQGNPNVAIIDVRTPAEYQPDHLEGAININYYDADFADQLNAINKSKTYLIHCKSGGRSVKAFNKMQELGFREVYNLSGGINSWKSASLPTTGEFNCKLGVYACSYSPIDSIPFNLTDTITIRITNQANDTLKINQVLVAGATEYNSNFTEHVELTGAQNFDLKIFYKPMSVGTNTLKINLKTNAADSTLTLVREATLKMDVIELQSNLLKVYPTPAQDQITFDLAQQAESYSITSITGQGIIQKKISQNNIDISQLNNGIYILSIESNKRYFSTKFVVSH